MYETFEDYLAALGLDALTITADQLPAIQAAWRLQQKPGGAGTGTSTANTDLETILAGARLETERRSRITTVIASALQEHPQNVDVIERIGRLAIDGRWDAQRAELEILRAGRMASINVLTPGSTEPTGEVLEAAMCREMGLSTIEEHYDTRTLEVADRRHRGGIGLHEMIGIVAARNGFTRRVNGNNVIEALARCNFRPGNGEISADGGGASTLTISGILSNIANKFVIDAFNAVENTWQKVCSIRPVNDFKQITTYALTGDLTYKEVAPTGQIEHGTLGEEEYTNQATDYGRMLGIARKQLINDDAGALGSAAKRLGRGGALKVNEVHWTEYLADASTFYTAARGNYDDGTDTLMDLTGLANIHTLFVMLNDPDGNMTGFTPSIVVVPPQLWPAAWTFLLAAPQGDTTATKSPWTGMFELVQSRYLANSAITGYSTKAWYMQASPDEAPVIEGVFLGGQTFPVVQSAEMPFDMRGIYLRGTHDFGFKKQEYRAAVKAKGEA